MVQANINTEKLRAVLQARKSADKPDDVSATGRAKAEKQFRAAKRDLLHDAHALHCMRMRSGNTHEQALLWVALWLWPDWLKLKQKYSPEEAKAAKRSELENALVHYCTGELPEMPPIPTWGFPRKKKRRFALETVNRVIACALKLLAEGKNFANMDVLSKTVAAELAKSGRISAKSVDIILNIATTREERRYFWATCYTVMSASKGSLTWERIFWPMCQEEIARSDRPPNLNALSQKIGLRLGYVETTFKSTMHDYILPDQLPILRGLYESVMEGRLQGRYLKT